MSYLAGPGFRSRPPIVGDWLSSRTGRTVADEATLDPAGGRASARTAAVRRQAPARRGVPEYAYPGDGRRGHMRMGKPTAAERGVKSQDVV